MYTYILILKGTNKDLATYEFENLWQVYNDEKIFLKQIENTFYEFETNLNNPKIDKILSRLTFTNNLFRVLVTGKTLDDYKLNVSNLDFDEFKKGSFSARIKKMNFENNDFEYDDYLKSIWKKFENPKVDLKNPNSRFLFLHNNLAKEQLIFAVQIYENEKDYLRRMPKLRPIAMPYTLKSDMARASINLLNISSGRMLDPFCGIGGILLEASQMNFDIIGNDISWNDLGYLKENFNFFFPEKQLPFLTLSDSRTRIFDENSIDGLVTDIPYGRACRKLGVDLYENFLINAKIYLKPNARMVVIFADFVEFKEVALKYFNQVKQIDQYINKSMTRHILVLENIK